MKKQFLISVFSLILVSPSYGEEADGGTAGAFLQIPTGARPTAMGGAYISISDDGAAPSEKTRSRGGRPLEYDWNAFFIEIIRIANTPDGLPGKQSELIRDMLYWCENTWGKQPAESAAKQKISEIYNGLGLGRKSQKPSTG